MKLLLNYDFDQAAQRDAYLNDHNLKAPIFIENEK